MPLLEQGKGCWAERHQIPCPVLRVITNVTQRLHPFKKSLLAVFFHGLPNDITPLVMSLSGPFPATLPACLVGLFWFQLEFPIGVLPSPITFRGKALHAGEQGHKMSIQWAGSGASNTECLGFLNNTTTQSPHI